MTVMLRAMQADDSEAFVALAAAVPDGGLVQFARRYLVAPYPYYFERPGRAVAVVASHSNYDGLVGAGLVNLAELHLDGALHTVAYLSSLLVHPNYRRQGIATKLAQWRINWAQQQAGLDVCIMANIQRGNAGSLANARKWATQFIDNTTVAPLATLSRPPRRRTTCDVRSAGPDDLAAFAKGANQFYADHNFYEPLSADALAAWQAQHQHGNQPSNHLLVATNQQGRLVAGMRLRESGAHYQLQLVHKPAWMDAVNVVLRVLPSDGVLRQLELSGLWYAPGCEDAAHDLVQQTRYDWREQGNLLPFYYDSRGPLGTVAQVPFWLPTTSATAAIRAPFTLDETKLTHPYYWE